MQDQNEGRVNQKARTRNALLASAADLLRRGLKPTVEEAAAAAGISKRTAYRYFVSQEHLLADAALESMRGNFEGIMSEPLLLDQPSERLACLVSAIAKNCTDNETELRIMMRASLDQAIEGEPGGGSTRMRGQRRLDWIHQVLAPTRESLPADIFERLVSSLAVTIGIDAFLILRDICQLPPDRIESVMSWMSQTLLEATLREAEDRKRDA